MFGQSCGLLGHGGVTEWADGGGGLEWWENLTKRGRWRLEEGRALGSRGVEPSGSFNGTIESCRRSRGALA